MKESTKGKYRKNARGFYQRHFDGNIPTTVQILYVLHRTSSEYTSRSFSNLKSYLAFYLKERGDIESAEEIKNYINIDAKLGNCNKPLKKIKTLTEEEIKKIINHIKSNDKKAPTKKALINKRQLIAAVRLAKHLGCRPVEMPGIKRTGPTSFFITGAKKDEFGLRGLDRHLHVSSQKNADILEQCIGYLKGAKMGRVQDRFKYSMKKLFPELKKHPTLYIFRHIMGSNLKSSNYSDVEKAYVLGHQSTRSMEHYGYRNSGNGKVGVKPAVTLNEIQSLVRHDNGRRESKRINRLNIRGRNEAPQINF